MSNARLRAWSEPTSSSAAVAAIELGRDVLRAEMGAIEDLMSRLDERFATAARMVLACRGAVIVSGMGKAGIVGQKIAASLSSTGTPSFFLHPAEAVHGDLGCVRATDLVLLLSYSGETEEVTRLLPTLHETAASVLAITSHSESTLAKRVDLALLLGEHREACPLGLAPSCSTTAMLALGDALALVVSQQRGFSREQFAKFHPGGGLGRQLTKVEDIMRPLSECRVATDLSSVREVLIHVGRPGRRTGAIMLTDALDRLSGIFTDSDLARLLETSRESTLDRPIADVMTRNLQTVNAGCYLPDAMQILAQRRISELPVVTTDYRPLGLVDVTDVMSVMSAAWLNQEQKDESREPRIIPIRA